MEDIDDEDEVPENIPARKIASKLLSQNQGTSRRSSIFDGVPIRMAPVGDSIMSFACQPTSTHFGLNEEGGGNRPQKVEYENTYQVEPPKKFMAEPAARIIREVLNSHLSDTSLYESIHISDLTKVIAQEIKDKVKALDVQRYKIVCIVNIGQRLDQGVRVGSRCVWDDRRDTWASASFKNAHIFATGEVYAVCYE